MRAATVVALLGLAGCRCGGGGASGKPAPHPIDVAVTDSNTAVVMSDGTVLVWGYAKGAVGWIDHRDVAVPVRAGEIAGATEVVAGGFAMSSTVCAHSGSDWWCWGNPPALPLAGAVRWEGFPSGADRGRSPTRIDGFTGVKHIRFGTGPRDDGCAILADDSLACWRHDVAEPMLAHVVEVSLGASHTCAVTTAGEAYCWGNRRYGAVDGTPDDSSAFEPVLVPGVAGATAIAAGDSLSCARIANDQLACWGATFYGEGVVRFAGVPGATLFTGGSDVCEVAPAGAVRCVSHVAKYWCPHGIDSQGKPCTNGVTGYPADAPPLRAIDAPPAKKVAWGRDHVCSITVTDTLECSGRNAHGELGDGTLVDHTKGAVVAGLDAPAAAPPEPPTPVRRRRGNDWDHAPAGCARDPALGGTPAALQVISAWAMSEPPHLFIRDFPSDLRDVDLRGDERELRIDLSNLAPTTMGMVPFRLPFDIGPGGARVDLPGPSAIAELNASDGVVARFGKGTLMITAHDARWLCGTLDIRDDGGSQHLAGAFAAEIVGP